MVDTDTERLAAGVADLNDVPCSRFTMGLADLVAEYPWVSRENATVLILAQQDRSGG